MTEIIASSDKSFDDAVKSGIARTNQTLKNVRLKVTFVLTD